MGPRTGGTEVVITTSGLPKMPPAPSTNGSDSQVAGASAGLEPRCRFGDFSDAFEVMATIVDHPTRLSCRTPPSYERVTLRIYVSFTQGDFMDTGYSFLFAAPPEALSLAPQLAVTDGQETINVTGVGFDMFASAPSPSPSPSATLTLPRLVCRFGGVTVPAKVLTSSLLLCVTPKMTQPGPVDFALVLPDVAESSRSLPFLFYDPPRLTRVTPSCGPYSGGTQVEVSAEGLPYVDEPVNKSVSVAKVVAKVAYARALGRIGGEGVELRPLCRFGGTSTPMEILSATRALCTSPAGYGGADVQMSIDGGRRWFGPPLPFTYTGSSETPPFLAEAFPAVLYESGGVLLLRVDNLPTAEGETCSPACMFGMHSLAARVVKRKDVKEGADMLPEAMKASEVLVECTVPKVLAGAYRLTLALNGVDVIGSKERDGLAIAVLPPPVIRAVVPARGSIAGGELVEVVGTGLTLADDLPVWCRFTRDKETVIMAGKAVRRNVVHCLTPKWHWSEEVSLSVSTNGRDFFASHPYAAAFEYVQPPVVKGLTPQAADIDKPPSEVSVYGHGFRRTPHLKCRFGGGGRPIVAPGWHNAFHQHQDVTAWFVSESEIRCRLPPWGSPGAVNVSVTVDGVLWSVSETPFVWSLSQPILASTPPYVPVGTTDLTVEGVGFGPSGQGVKCRLTDSGSGKVPFLCSGQTDCVVSGKYVSPTEVSCDIPRIADIVKAMSAGHVGGPLRVGEGPLWVWVSCNGGTTWSASAVPFTLIDEPVVRGVSPSAVPIRGGAVVSVTVDLPPSTEWTYPLAASLPTRVLFSGGELSAAASLLSLNAQTGDTHTGAAYRAVFAVETPAVDTPKRSSLSLSITGVKAPGDASSVAVDFVANPKLRSLSPTIGYDTGGTRVAATTTDDSPFHKKTTAVRFGGDVLLPTMDPSTNTKLSFVTPKHANGTLTAPVTIDVDISTNFDWGIGDRAEAIRLASFSSERLPFTLLPTPAITHIHPAIGPKEGGTTMTITGSHLMADGAVTECSFIDTKVRAEQVTATSVVCRTPPLTKSGPVPLSVTLNGVDFVASPVPFFSYQGAKLHRVSPSFVSTHNGPQKLRLEGDKLVKGATLPTCRFCVDKGAIFVGAAEVKATGTMDLPALNGNGSSVNCIAPELKPGSVVRVSLTYDQQHAIDGDAHITAFTLDGYSPLAAPAGGLSTNNFVTVTGQGFHGASPVCRFGSRTFGAASSDDTHIRCTCPPAPSRATEQVPFAVALTNGGTPDDFFFVGGISYFTAPKVDGVSPRLLPAHKAVRIDLTGSHLDGAVRCLNCRPVCALGEYVSTRVEVVDKSNGTGAHCYMPPIHNGQEQLTLKLSFNGVSWSASPEPLRTYEVDYLDVDSGPVKGGTLVRVNGKGFPDPNTDAELQRQGIYPMCRFGQVQVPAHIVSPSILTCVSAPPALPEGSQLPMSVDFEITFAGHMNRTDLWTNTGHSFLFYSQPRIVSIEPTAGLFTRSSRMTVRADRDHPFPLWAAERSRLRCGFGPLGSTPAALINPTTIVCFTPKTSADYRVKAPRIRVRVEVSCNGVDFGSSEDSHNNHFTYFGPVDTMGGPVTEQGLYVKLVVVFTAFILFAGIAATMWAWSKRSPGARPPPHSHHHSHTQRRRRSLTRGGGLQSHHMDDHHTVGADLSDRQGLLGVGRVRGGTSLPAVSEEVTASA
ncbi:unnamed protein product [Vitrella brassicaformis CCMP3155]|uniref:IPT/TIG domain-containing protein n=1 Tax=Vitrella brassicaformis (strain CCMP3155) TaxID=1169540 RepID=A0A0G4E8D8_VITBC|nr:unnamed protein product [Vitrella brassicaformis CCMP3155]|eukprot:CEL91709.1 unnamed protein product [Vitrella brassicaformis CCMP3155]